MTIHRAGPVSRLSKMTIHRAGPVYSLVLSYINFDGIIIGSDRRPETKQEIEGKIVRFRSGKVRVTDRVRVGIIDCRSEPDRRSEPNTVHFDVRQWSNCGQCGRVPCLGGGMMRGYVTYPTLDK